MFFFSNFEDQVPPGSLALDAMLYFARYHPEKYTRVVLENSGRGDEYDCPFARAAIELTKLLCELLKVSIRTICYLQICHS